MWWNRKTDQPAEAMKPALTPGLCECGHNRCSHTGGVGSCHVGYPASKEWPDGASCSCAIFILDPDNDDDDTDDDTPEVPNDPEVVELERMING